MVLRSTMSVPSVPRQNICCSGLATHPPRLSTVGGSSRKKFASGAFESTPQTVSCHLVGMPTCVNIERNATTDVRCDSIHGYGIRQMLPPVVHVCCIDCSCQKGNVCSLHTAFHSINQSYCKIIRSTKGSLLSSVIHMSYHS